MAGLKLTLLHALLAAGSPVVNANPDNHAPHHPFTVETTSGVYTPYLSASSPSATSFLDVPYAQNPTGPLRFAPPVPLRRNGNDSIIYATELHGACLQYTPPVLQNSITTEAEPSFLVGSGDFSGTTEDCLRLSIYTPKDTVEHTTSRGRSKTYPVQ
jgi:acetylcholinesterase